MTCPFGLTARSEFERPVNARFVVVALVELALTVVKFVIVELAATSIPTVVVGVRYPLTKFQVLPKLLAAAKDNVFAENVSPPPIVVP